MEIIQGILIFAGFIIFWVILTLPFFIDTNVFKSWLESRKQRIFLREEKKQEIAILKLRHKQNLELAAKIKEPVSLLALDPKFGEFFDQRLRIALEDAKRKEILDKELNQEQSIKERK